MWKGTYFILFPLPCHVEPSHNCMVGTQIAADGDGLQMWGGRCKLKHSQTTYNGWYSGFRVGREANHCSQSKASVYGKFTKGLRLARIFVR